MEAAGGQSWLWLHGNNGQREHANADRIPAGPFHGDRHRRHYCPWGRLHRLVNQLRGSRCREVARRRGFVAIVLKYRTKQVEGKDAAQPGESTRAAFMAQLNDHALIAEDGKYGIADGIQAVKVVRAHAAEWGISPDRIVFTGFSAGGMITEMTAVKPDARPNYAAPIYGATFPQPPPIPQGLPPFFMAMAQDDNLADPNIVAFYDALKAAGYKPEFHIYSSGGHGWGMRKQGKTSDHWIDEFYYWLEAQGLTRPHK
jgi:predicted esterase